MADIRSLFELTPEELRSKPVMRNWLPCRVQIIRVGWFEWYWLGHCIDSRHTLLIGPCRTKRGAKRVWDKVPHIVTETGPHTRALQDYFDSIEDSL